MDVHAPHTASDAVRRERRPELGEPFAVRNARFRNRFALASHVVNLNEEANQPPDLARAVPGERAAAYYARRAQGGAALIVTEEIPVHPGAFRFRAAADPSVEGFTEGLAEIGARCRQEGALCFAALSHPGSFADWDLSFLPAVSPSGLASPGGFHASKAATEADFAAIVAGFGETAARVRAAGLDGVEIDAGPLSLIEQLFAPALNLREDRWGAGEGGRRLVRDIVDAVRAALGDGPAISLKVSSESDPGIGLEDSLRAEQLAWMARHSGADILHLCRGTYGAAGHPGTDGTAAILPVAAALRERLSGDRPASRGAAGGGPALMVSGGFLDVADCEAALRGGADLVGLSRAMIADPDFARHAASGRAEDIRPCVACNQHCMERRARDYTLTCLVNPSAGREARATPAPAAHPTRVMVVGAGPGGLEAALASARRGHAVTVIEAGNEIGGQMRLVARQPGRERFGKLLAWYAAQLEKHQVELRIGEAFDPSDVPDAAAASNATAAPGTTQTPGSALATGSALTSGSALVPGSALIVATGGIPDGRARQRSAPGFAALPGLERGRATSAEAVLRDDVSPSGRVLLLDDCDDWKSLGTALFLAESGASVALVTRHAAPGARIAAGGRLGSVRRRFVSLGVREIGESRLDEWHGDAATIRHLPSGETTREPFDWLVTATTATADASVPDALTAVGAAFVAVGDCLSPRNAGDAIREGRAAAAQIEGPEAPGDA